MLDQTRGNRASAKPAANAKSAPAITTAADGRALLPCALAGGGDGSVAGSDGSGDESVGEGDGSVAGSGGGEQLVTQLPRLLYVMLV